jgi:hypothetical protein
MHDGKVVAPEVSVGQAEEALLVPLRNLYRPSRPNPPVPRWVWIVLGVMAAALVALVIAVSVEVHEAATNVKAGSESAGEAMKELTAEVSATNKELSSFNTQFESVSASRQEKAASAEAKK